jgi:hypothetical protein
MADVDQLGRLDRAQRDRIVDEAVRSVLVLVERALPEGPDGPGPEIGTAAEIVDGLLELPVISAAELLDPADPRCGDGVTLTWPVSADRVLAVRLLPSLESTVLPDVLACLAGVVRAFGHAAEGPAGKAGAAGAAGTTTTGGTGGVGDAGLVSRAVVGDVMHKLSTPLTSIMAYASLLADPDTGRLNEDQQQFVEILERNARRLMELVNEFHAGLKPDSAPTRQEDQ